MSIIPKKILLNLIKESMSDMDEMAFRAKGVQGPRKDKEGKYIIHKFIPVWKEGNPTPQGGKGVPDAWIINPDRVEGGARLVVPIGCKELSEFINENKEWLDSLHILHRIKPELLNCRTKQNPTGMWTDQPRNVRLGTEYIPTGLHYDAEETIKRTMFAMIQYYLGDSEVNKKLEECSIPVIYARDEAHLDRHGIINNDEVNYQTHTYNAYEDDEQFYKFVISRMAGIDLGEDYKEYHLARQFNKIYNNWIETKKQKSEYKGKTEKYLLDKEGLDELNLSNVVRTDLKINGKLMGDKYVWTLQFIVKYGSKLKEEPRIKGGLKLDKDIVINKTANVSPRTVSGERPFTDDPNIKNYTIIDDGNIRNTLEECLEELRSRILSDEFSPIQSVREPVSMMK